jgi:hypothetical protein
LDTPLTFRPSARLRWLPLRAGLFAAACAGLAWCYRWTGGGWALTGLLLAGAALFAMLGVVVFLRLPKAMPSLTVGPDGLVVAVGGQHRSVAWTDLDRIGVTEQRRGALRRRWLIAGRGTAARSGLVRGPAS